MAVTLNKSAFEFAQNLIIERKAVYDERDAWSEHQPTAAEENAYIRRHGFEAYGKWHMGVEEEAGVKTKARYKFPYGDFRRVHRCGVISGESRAGQYKHFDIENAFAHLHGMIDEEVRSTRPKASD